MLSGPFLGPYVCITCARPTAFEDMFRVNATAPAGKCRDCQRAYGRARDAARVDECAFLRCKNKARARGGLCTGHLYQQRRGRPLAPLRMNRGAEAALVRDDHGRKQCVRCTEWRPESEFDADARNNDGLRQSCKMCRRLRTIARRFNITAETYFAMLAAQGGRCAICSSDSPGLHDWHIDHDHACCPERGRSCGECVRGLLCSACNVGLAMFRDNTDSLRAAIAYLDARRPAA